MVGTIKKENSPTDVDSYSQINSDDLSKKNENSDPKSSTKSGSSKKGSSSKKACCCCRCCRGQDSDDDERGASNEDSKETIPKTVASPDPDLPNQTESDHDKKIMTLEPKEPVPSTSPPGSPVGSAEESSHSNPVKHFKTPPEFKTFDPEPLVLKADKDIEVLSPLMIEEDQDPKILEPEVDPEELVENQTISDPVVEEKLTIPDPAVEEKLTIPDPAVEEKLTIPDPVIQEKEESDSDDSDVEKNAAFHTDKLSVEGNDKKDLELLERRKNSREIVSENSGFDEDRPSEYLQLSKSKSKSESSSQTLSDENKQELKDSGSDPKRPACVGYKWKMFSWFNKKKP